MTFTELYVETANLAQLVSDRGRPRHVNKRDDTVLCDVGGRRLTNVAILLALGCLGVRLVTGATPAIVEMVRPVAVPLAFAAAATSMLGSLYYSEVAGFDPCHKCWQQRAMMYPAAVILGFALLARHAVARQVAVGIALALALVGVVISTLHRFEQQFPDSANGACDISNPCSGRYVNEFGFITIPTMAWVGFGLIIVFAALSLFTSPTTDA
ncbi:MAG: disulfide bond formation protein B [Acidimicrobiales bacterium]